MWRMTAGSGMLMAVLLLVGIAPAAGQAELDWGLRLGVALHTVVFEDPATDSQTDPLMGFHVGVAVARELAGPLSAEVDVLMSREGFRGRGAHTGDLRRDFLAVPVLFRIRTPTRVELHLTAGVAARLGIRCVQTDVALAGSVACDDPVMRADWAAFDAAGMVGGGIALPWGGRKLVSEVLLSWGLRDLNAGPFIPGRARSVSVGLSFAVLSPWGGDRQGGAS